MSTSLEVKLRTAAAANPALVAFLGTSPFRWYGPQEVQNAPYPNIAVQLISAVPQYSTAARLITCEYRVQFTIWDTNLAEARNVESALLSFLDGFNAYNAGDHSPLQRNRVVNRRTGGNAQTSPTTYWRIVDAMIWNNETT